MTAESDALTRRQAMHEIVRPALQSAISPIYHTELDVQEQSWIPAIANTRDLQFFSGVANLILAKRWQALLSKGTGLDEIQALHESIGLFHRPAPEDAINEGRATGVTVPLHVASHIAVLEASPDNKKSFDPHTFSRSVVFPLDPEGLVVIMNRQSFRGIIQILGKGHNGTLGKSSADVVLRTPYFFEFQKQSGARLLVPEAYEFTEGKVRGLSTTFRLAAAATRHARIDLLEEGQCEGETKDLLAGCPFREGFDMALDFLIATLRFAQNKRFSRSLAIS